MKENFKKMNFLLCLFTICCLFLVKENLYASKGRPLKGSLRPNITAKKTFKQQLEEILPSLSSSSFSQRLEKSQKSEQAKAKARGQKKIRMREENLKENHEIGREIFFRSFSHLYESFFKEKEFREVDGLFESFMRLLEGYYEIEQAKYSTSYTKENDLLRIKNRLEEIFREKRKDQSFWKNLNKIEREYQLALNKFSSTLFSLKEAFVNRTPVEWPLLEKSYNKLKEIGEFLLLVESVRGNSKEESQNKHRERLEERQSILNYLASLYGSLEALKNGRILEFFEKFRDAFRFTNNDINQNIITKELRLSFIFAVYGFLELKNFPIEEKDKILSKIKESLDSFKKNFSKKLNEMAKKNSSDLIKILEEESVRQERLKEHQKVILVVYQYILTFFKENTENVKETRRKIEDYRAI